MSTSDVAKRALRFHTGGVAAREDDSSRPGGAPPEDAFWRAAYECYVMNNLLELNTQP